jgi:hypothetical protein
MDLKLIARSIGPFAAPARGVPATRYAIWDFVAAVEDLRCLVCRKRIDYGDHGIFECTSLCQLCAGALNEEQ